MVKKIFLNFSICALLFTVAGCNDKTENSKTTDSSLATSSNTISTNSGGEEKVISFKAYRLERDIYYQFIEDSQQSILEQKGNGTEIFIFSRDVAIINNQPSDVIRCEEISAEPVEVYDVDENSRLDIDLLLYDSFVDFIGDRSEIERYLKQNEITGNVENIALIVTSSIPKAIWVVADKNNYFITIDEKSDDLNNPIEKAYTYRIYKQSEYYEKFKMKDAKLIVEGKNITAGNYVKIHYSYADLPLTAIMSALGAKVEWKSKETVKITFDDKDYILDTTERSLIEFGDNTVGNLITPVPGGFRYCQVIGDEFILDSDTMKSAFFLAGINIKINIDYDNLIVNVE